MFCNPWTRSYTVALCCDVCCREALVSVEKVAQVQQSLLTVAWYQLCRNMETINV